MSLLGAIGGIGGVVGSLFGDDDDADKAVKAQQAAQRSMEGRLNASADAIDEAAQAYIKEINDLGASFDPMEFQASYDSLYEEVILPLERDYAEYVLPAVQAAYSGGVYGAGEAQSGARKEAVARSSRELSKNKSQAVSAERNNALTRNVAMDARQRTLAKEKLSAATLAPTTRAGQAATIYQGQSDTIAAQLAAGQQKTNNLLSLPSAILQGVESGSALQTLLGRKKDNDSSLRSTMFTDRSGR